MTAVTLCIGAAHWDLIARAARSLRPGVDAPGRIERRPGGVALNIALALAASQQASALLAAVSRDATGTRLVAEACARGVDCTRVVRHDGESDGYAVIEDANGEVFAAVADCSGLERAGPALLRQLRAGFEGQVVLDGNLPGPLLGDIAAAPALAAARLAVVAASPAKAGRLACVLLRRRATLYLNRAEAEALCGRPFPDSAAAAGALLDRGAEEAVVTDGAAATAHAGPAGLIARMPEVVAGRSTTGAGDAFLAGHLAARGAGLDPARALEAALAASARHIARDVARRAS